VLRKLYATFGLDQLARDSFKRQLERRPAEQSRARAGRGEGSNAAMA